MVIDHIDPKYPKRNGCGVVLVKHCLTETTETTETANDQRMAAASRPFDPWNELLISEPDDHI